MEQSAPDDLIITAAGIDKAAGMLSLAASLGIKREEILAIGNDGNDLSMIREAGVGVAMGGSPDYIKTAADYVTDTVENRGAALAIRKFTQPCHSRA
jgi:hydroxymethylpyrimidine pyrophosphatase-like HAD family hydrolase